MLDTYNVVNSHTEKCEKLLRSYRMTYSSLYMQAAAAKIDIEIAQRVGYLALLMSVVLRYTTLDMTDVMTMVDGVDKSYNEVRPWTQFSQIIMAFDERLGEEEKKYGTREAICDALAILNNEFDNPGEEARCAEAQIEAIDILMEDIKEYGIRNWFDQNGKQVGNEDDFCAMEIVWLATAIKEKDPLDNFHLSAELCSIFNQLETEIERYTQLLSRRYDEQTYYDNNYKSVLYPWGDRAKPFAVFWFVAYIIAMALGDGAVFVMTIAVIIAYIAVRSYDNNKAEDYAKSLLETYHTQHMEQIENKEKWQEQVEEYKKRKDRLAEELQALVPVGGVPKQWWPIAEELWSLVEQRRADNFKEAINLYLYILNEEERKEMERERERTLNSLSEQIEDMKRNLENVIANQEAMEFNQNLDMALNAYYLSKL